MREQQFDPDIGRRDRSARSENGRSGAGVGKERADGWVLTEQNSIWNPTQPPARERGTFHDLQKEAQHSTQYAECVQHQQPNHTDHALPLKQPP